MATSTSSSSVDALSPSTSPTNSALQEAFARAFATEKALYADYWFMPDDPNQPHIGMVNKTRLRLVHSDQEYTTWFIYKKRSADGTALIAETENSIYIVPAIIKAIPFTEKEEEEDEDEEDDDDARGGKNKRKLDSAAAADGGKRRK